MKKLYFLIVMIIFVGITTTSAFAIISHEDSVEIDGNLDVDGKLTVTNGGFVFNRTDNTQTTMQLINPDKQTTFQFVDPDDEQKYLIRSTPGSNGNFEMIDFSGSSPVVRYDITVERSNGNVGIGMKDATEELELVGDFKLSGNILSDSDMEIKPNGDLCLGSGCP